MVAPPPRIPSREEKKGVWIEVKETKIEKKERATPRVLVKKQTIFLQRIQKQFSHGGQRVQAL
jgi:hypothetical protein